MGTEGVYRALQRRIFGALNAASEFWEQVEKQPIPEFDGVEVSDVPANPHDPPGPPDPPEPPADLVIEGSLEEGWREPDPPASWHERSAHSLATILLWLFGSFLALALIAGLWFAGCDAQSVERAEKIFIPILTSVGDMAVKVFSPLLAFVFGYYFSRESRSSH